jgi:hypothetical protein
VKVAVPPTIPLIVWAEGWTVRLVVTVMLVVPDTPPMLAVTVHGPDGGAEGAVNVAVATPSAV